MSMASTSRTPERSTSPPQSEAQPSSSAVEGICLPFDEAINQLPVFMQPKDEREHDELETFLSQVDELHKPDGLEASATSIFNYIQRVLESDPQAGEGASQQDTLTRSEAFDRLPELPVPLLTITGDISSEIAYNVIDKFDSRNITISVLNKLQQYSWETKVALTVATYILSFGDFGLNLSTESKVSLDDMSMFVKQLLEITSCVAEFEKLPKVYMTLPDPKVREARTHLVVAVYWIIKAVMVNSASHIMRMSSRGYNKSGKANSTPSDDKLEAISGHLKTTLLLLQELLEGNIDMEAYNKIKEIVNKEDHSDNLEVLKALIPSSSYEAPQLYHNVTNRKVHLNELEGNYVLLLLTDSKGINENEVFLLDKTLSGMEERMKNYKLVVFPVVDPSLQQRTSSTKIRNQKLIDNYSTNCYTVDEPWIIKREVIKFISDDWNFKGESIVVVLDPQGKVVNQNAFTMMFIWLDDAFPFTRTREETLWKEQTWSLDFLSLIKDTDQLFKEDKYIYFYGGTKQEWVKSFLSNTKGVHSAMQIPMKPVFIGPESLWLFWGRIECMIYSMVQQGKFDVIFHEIQRLLNYHKSNTEWAILAKGSNILLVGEGNIMLSTLQQLDLWREKASKEGFEVGFISHYQQLYRKEACCVQRILLPTAALNNNLNTVQSMHCPDCHGQMNKYIAFVCDHPPW